jgi:hypothetical protein
MRNTRGSEGFHQAVRQIEHRPGVPLMAENDVPEGQAGNGAGSVLAEGPAPFRAILPTPWDLPHPPFPPPGRISPHDMIGFINRTHAAVRTYGSILALEKLVNKLETVVNAMLRESQVGSRHLGGDGGFTLVGGCVCGGGQEWGVCVCVGGGSGEWGGGGDSCVGGRGASADGCETQYDAVSLHTPGTAGQISSWPRAGAGVSDPPRVPYLKGAQYGPSKCARKGPRCVAGGGGRGGGSCLGFRVQASACSGTALSSHTSCQPGLPGLAWPGDACCSRSRQVHHRSPRA